MDFPLASAVAPLLQVIDSIGSTNAELARRERLAAQPHGTALATLDQTAGRGRLDRQWVAPPGTALAVSVVIAADLGIAALPWLPIIGGLAARDAVADALPESIVSVKWPNDVLVSGADGVERKIAGVLAEFITTTGAVVLGIGVNTTMRRADLPVPTATSIEVELGVDTTDAVTLADRIAADVIRGVLHRVAALADAGGDASGSGLLGEALGACATIGRRVRVSLPGDRILTGVASGLDASGAILVSTDDGATTAVHAGDVTHLRYE